MRMRRRWALFVSASLFGIMLTCASGPDSDVTIPKDTPREGQLCSKSQVGDRSSGLRCTHSHRGNRWEYPSHNYGMAEAG